MQTTSALYQTLLASGSGWFEQKLVIDTVGTFGEDSILSMEASRTIMEKTMEIGNAVAGEIDIKMLKPTATIPRMAKLMPYVRINSGSQQSEWLQQGVFFIDTRKASVNSDGAEVLTIHGYDAMLFAEQEYPSTSHAWPYLDWKVVAEIASTMGVSVDSRTNEFLTASIKIELPTGYTMREVLANIAACNCGNFVMTNEGKLLFVPLYGLDSEEWVTGSYLADENGNAIYGSSEGWYILV